MSSNLAIISPGLKSPLLSTPSFNGLVFLQSSMHPTVSGLVPLHQQLKLVFPLWLIQTLGRWSSNCYNLYIRTPPSVLQRVLVCWLPQTPQDKGCGTRFYNVSLLVVHNCIVLYAGSIWDVFWVHTCYFYLRVAGRVGPQPTLVYSLLGGDALHSLPHPLPCRVCRCHPRCTAHC